MNYLEKNAKGAGKRLLEIIGVRKRSVLDRLKDSGSKAVDSTKKFYNKNKTKIQYGGGGLALGAGAYAGGSALANRKNKQVKKASYYELGHYLLEKDAADAAKVGKIGETIKYLKDKLRNGGESMTWQGAKNLYGSTARKVKSKIHSAKTYVRGKAISGLESKKKPGSGLKRWDSTVKGLRTARPWVGGTAVGVGGSALYNKYKNKDQD